MTKGEFVGLFVIDVRGLFAFDHEFWLSSLCAWLFEQLEVLVCLLRLFEYLLQLVACLLGSC